ncbi:dolichyl-phosphate-mannose--protein mannosyltransferase [Paeniglutamicibacter antarcticus]|uniref:dolichyl-phosphate-mannose--protein mannosyltransferase n=1 Tax=Paeniglutamicibacter antarcticus TaxID=494023 RepID=UPI001AE618D4
MTTATTQRTRRWVIDPDGAFGIQALRDRLVGPLYNAGMWGWIVPLAVTLVGAVLRFTNLQHPHLLIFDETYYVKDAYTMMEAGYELEWGDNPNEAFVAGDPVPKDSASFVVHPPLGKWLIAAGMWLFGTDNGLGWRFSGALFGTLAVLLCALVAQKLFSSVLLGGIAGLLAAVDGHQIVMSRTGLLDIFLMFFVLAGFFALLLDRFHGRGKLARALATKDGSRPAERLLGYGPWLWWRPWRLVAGVMFGCAAGVKWSALSFIAVFSLMTVLWDLSARRRAGIRHWIVAGLFRDGIPAFLLIIPTTFAVYLATWTGWLVSADGRYRQWAAENPSATWDWIPGVFRSLGEYHRAAYAFHQGLGSSHGWESSPWTWLFAGRPVLFFYESRGDGEYGCTSQNCVQAITDLPNPIMWWAATLSLLLVLFYWIGARDWRAGAILSALAAGFLPWFAYPDRTMFFFYTLPFAPFMVLALCYVMGRFLPRDRHTPWHRRQAVWIIGIFLALVVLVSAYFLPVWTGEMITYDSWRNHIWMPSWG